MKTISILIPVFNEEKNIEKIFNEYEKIKDKLSNDFSLNSMLIFIDDGSRDNTFTEISKCFSKNNKTKGSYIKLQKNFGKDKAIISALNSIESEYYVIIDADLQTPIKFLPKMLSAIYTKDVDIVKAVKEKEPYNLTRKLLTSIFFFIAKILKISEFKKGSSDFIMFTKKVRDKIINLKESEFLLRSIIAWFGFKEETIHFKPDKSMKSSFPIKKLFILGIRGIVTFSNFLRLNFIISLIYWITSILYGSLIIYNKITGKIVTGISSVLLLTMISFAILFLMIAILGETVKIIFDEVKKRPTYIIEKIIKFEGNNG